MWQRPDGINIVVLFNEDGSPHYASTMVCTIATAIDNLIANSVTWPTLCVDGFWVDFNAKVPSFYGAYRQPSALHAPPHIASIKS